MIQGAEHAVRGSLSCFPTWAHHGTPFTGMQRCAAPAREPDRRPGIRRTIDRFSHPRRDCGRCLRTKKGPRMSLRRAHPRPGLQPHDIPTRWAGRGMLVACRCHYTPAAPCATLPRGCNSCRSMAEDRIGRLQRSRIRAVRDAANHGRLSIGAISRRTGPQSHVTPTIRPTAALHHGRECCSDHQRRSCRSPPGRPPTDRPIPSHPARQNRVTPSSSRQGKERPAG